MLIFLPSLFVANENSQCIQTVTDYEVYKENGVLISVSELRTKHRSQHRWLIISDEEIHTIALNAFKNLSLFGLFMNLTNGELNLTSESFNGLSNLTDLSIMSSRITSLETNFFKPLTSLASIALTMNINGQNLNDSLSEKKSLKTLRVINSFLGNISSATVPVYPQVEELRFEMNNITPFQVGAFLHSNNLLYLRFIQNGLTGLQLGMFYGLNKLVTLLIREKMVTSLPKGVFNNLDRLRYLQFFESGISHIEADAFAGLNIQHLDLDANKLVTLVPGMFNGLDNLHELWLTDNSITHIPKNVFNTYNLNYLMMDFNQIETIEDDAFAGLKLTQLNLSNNRLKYIGPGIFRNFNSYYLILDQNYIHTIETNSFLYSNIQVFDIYNNNITEVDKFAWGFQNYTKIVSLDSTDFEDTSLSFLCELTAHYHFNIYKNINLYLGIFDIQAYF